MHRILFLIAMMSLIACEPAIQAPPKRPNTELIAGTYERRAPDKPLAIVFTPDSGFRIAKDKTTFDREPPEGAGTYTINGDTLTIEATKGMCAESDATKKGTYKIVLSKIGIRFTKVEDSCERRSKFDGQTWWRVQ